MSNFTTSDLERKFHKFLSGQPSEERVRSAIEGAEEILTGRLLGVTARGFLYNNYILGNDLHRMSSTVTDVNL